MQQSKNAKRHNLERGQSLMEMALGFVLFLVVIMGLLDLGRLFFIYIALEDSAGEAALYLALNGDCPLPCGEQAPQSASCTEDSNVCNAPNNAFDRAQKAFSGLQIDWDRVTIDHRFIPADTGTEAMVEVSIEYPFELLTPVISRIVGDDTFTLRAEAIHVQIAD